MSKAVRSTHRAARALALVVRSPWLPFCEPVAELGTMRRAKASQLVMSLMPGRGVWALAALATCARRRKGAQRRRGGASPAGPSIYR
jgi:hypothetical protein